MTARRDAVCAAIALAAASVLAREAIAQDAGGLDAGEAALDAALQDAAEPDATEPDAAAVAADAPSSVDAPDSAIADAPAPHDAPPAPSPDATPSPDGEGYCCPTRASCDCWWTGGFSVTGSECGRWGFCEYDADPAGAIRSIDAHGCEVLAHGLLSCNRPPDTPWRDAPASASADAGASASAAAGCGCRFGAPRQPWPSSIALTLATLARLRRSRRDRAAIT